MAWEGHHRDAQIAFRLGCLSFVLAACGITGFAFLGACVGLSFCARLVRAAAVTRAGCGTSRGGSALAWRAAGAWLAIVIAVGTASATVWGRDAYRLWRDGPDTCAKPRICVGT